MPIIYSQPCNLSKQFERQTANNVIEYSKAFWNNYGKIEWKTCPAIGNIEGVDGKLCTSDEDKSNTLNTFPAFLHERILTQHLSFT